MPDKSKFEREIDEILEKTDAEDSFNTSNSGDIGAKGKSRKPSSKPKTFEPFSGTAPKRSQAKKRSSSIGIKPGNLTIAGIATLALAAFTPTAQIPVALVGVVILAIGYALWFRTGSGHLDGSTSATGGTGFFGRSSSPKKSQPSTPEVKYWRGRRIEEKPEPPKTPKSPDSDDLGKIIDFRSRRDRDNDDKS